VLILIPDIKLDINQMSNMVICSLANGDHERLLHIMQPTVEHYGRKHNIDTIFLTERLCPERPAAWDKIVLIKGLLKYYEVVMWMDSDTIIVNPEPNIKNEIRPDTIMLLCTHQCVEPCCPNTGVWIVKNNPKSLELLEEIWGQTDMINHHPWEQGALFKLLGFPNPKDYYKYLGLTRYSPYVETLDIKWNSMMSWGGVLGSSNDPVIEHHCGIPIKDRLEKMRESYQKFEQRK
jgi:hypothetical protein